MANVFMCHLEALKNSTINNFIPDISLGADVKRVKDSSVVRISLPFKDQMSANAVRRQMKDLSHKIGTIVEPIFVSKKLEQDLKPKQIRPPIVNQQCVVYSFLCDLFDADSALLNIRTRPSVNTLWKLMGN